MSESDQVYGQARARELEQLLRALATRIQELDAQNALLAHAGELMKLTGDLRSELFHYEVRATYDTPEIAESRRVVERAKQQSQPDWRGDEWTPESDEEDPTW
ncbi:MAG TPA: hypothetical protein VFK13_10880 [Gemmatimonadaceae bacterium]|nr:hypothetical protein [Gemmatimonadaceae bacterium]